ncbi:MAG: roadblock/LC7 domain-containing protein [Chloroflexota bacterium]
MSTELQELSAKLRSIQSENGLLAAAAVGLDGLLIEGASAEGIDLDAIAAVSAPGLLMMSDLASELGEGLSDVTTMEYANHTVVLMPLNDDVLFVAIAEARSMNLGQMRIIVRRSMEDLRRAVGAG